MFFGWGTFVPVILVAAGVAPFFFTPTLYFLASLEFASSVVDEPSLKVMTLSGFPSFVTRAVALTVGVDVAPWPGFDPEVVGWGLLVEPAVEEGLLGVGFGAADVEPAFVEDGLAVEGFELDGFGCDVVGFVLLGLSRLALLRYRGRRSRSYSLLPSSSHSVGTPTSSTSSSPTSPDEISTPRDSISRRTDFVSSYRSPLHFEALDMDSKLEK